MYIYIRFAEASRSMFGKVDIKEQLEKVRRKSHRNEELLLSEAKRILKKDLFTEKKILANLKQYNRSFQIVDEEDVDAEFIFSAKEIKKVAVDYRLKFLDSQLYKPEIPYEAVLKVKHIETKYSKELKNFRVLATPASFIDKEGGECSLFVKTNYDNFYLIHRWGNKLSLGRKIKYWPLRSFETLVTTVMITTLIITLSLPTAFITLDSKATYWSGYRGAAFFHLLIFDFGVTVYFTFAFALNFSSSVWNKRRNFD